MYTVKCRTVAPRNGKAVTFAKGSIDLSRYALLQPGTHTVKVDLPLQLQPPFGSSVVTLKLSLAYSWRSDWKDADDSASSVGGSSFNSLTSKASSTGTGFWVRQNSGGASPRETFELEQARLRNACVGTQLSAVSSVVCSALILCSL